MHADDEKAIKLDKPIQTLAWQIKVGLRRKTRAMYSKQYSVDPVAYSGYFHDIPLERGVRVLNIRMQASAFWVWARNISCNAQED